MNELMARNKSHPIQFTLLCFSDFPQIPLFIIFLAIYLNIILGNITVFSTIALDSHLHTPMFVFLSNLSVLDICYTSTILPNLLYMLSTQRKIMSFASCMTQLYFFLGFACTEMTILAVMAYDRYVAICHPLSYNLLMSSRNCFIMVIIIWIVAFLEPISFTVLVSNFYFCSTNQIDHFFCDLTPLLKLSCSDTSRVDMTSYILSILVGLSTFGLTLVSYIYIVINIMNIHSAGGRSKTFSTCASHLTCVLLFYGTTLSLYLKPTSMYSPKQDKFFSLLYIILIPLLNPVIYTLKNNQFKDAFRKLIHILYFLKCN